MSDAHIAERLNDLHVVADTFADRLSELATLLQDDEGRTEITNLLTAALGGHGGRGGASGHCKGEGTMTEQQAGELITEAPTGRGVWKAIATWGPELAAALARAQGAAKAVEKDATNTFHKYKYASAEAIIAEAREALAQHGLSVVPLSIGPMPGFEDHEWQAAVRLNEQGQEVDDSWIKRPRRILCRYRLIHESGQWMDFESSTPAIPEKGRPEDKAEFGSRTENLGYALRDLLLIPREAAEGAQQPSGRDDRESQPRGPKAQQPRNGSSSPPSQNGSQGTSGSPANSGSSSGGQPAGDADKAKQIDGLLQNAKDGTPSGLGLTKSKAFDWLKDLFGRGTAAQLTRDQQEAAAILAVAAQVGQEQFEAKRAELAKAGRCSPGKAAAA